MFETNNCIIVKSFVGALDASEFEVRQPLKQLPAYKSRKCKTTIKVQAVATLDLVFIDVSVGWPGSIHDSRIYKNSALSKASSSPVQEQSRVKRRMIY